MADQFLAHCGPISPTAWWATLAVMVAALVVGLWIAFSPLLKRRTPGERSQDG